jgi:hypothetical protein
MGNCCKELLARKVRVQVNRLHPLGRASRLSCFADGYNSLDGTSQQQYILPRIVIAVIIDPSLRIAA